MCAKTVADNLSKILRIKESRNSYGIWQTSCFWRRSQSLELQESPRSQNLGCNSISIRSTSMYPNKLISQKKGCLTVECDEMWSFVGLKSREIVGMHVGSCDRAGAEALWKSFPPVQRQCAVCYTDFWSTYEQVLPQNRHRAVGEESRKTNRIERFNLTLRKRISRLVRKTLSFSNKGGYLFRDFLDRSPHR